MADASEPTSSALRLNLGSGQNPLPGYVNVDKFGAPDVTCDLEQFPWPWETSSVGEVVLNHVLEHLGESTAVYLGIIKELYRVCRDGAIVTIAVPHPRHDDFLNDPTHVRIVTPEGMLLFSKKLNRESAARKFANSPLGLYLDVDFELIAVNCDLDESWHARLSKGKITEQQARDALTQYNNVVKQFRMQLKVIKPG